jgi:hypothetical protein
MSTDGELQPGQGVVKQDGVTGAERYLQRLCERTFLSLWSYPGVYRDQGQTAKSREGKEVCDLLVVFENHVIIFSDKHCQFPDSGNLTLDWSRWYRKAVLKSADQVWGAERWIRSYPGRLFLDRACTRPFPIELPDPSTARFHRVVVAHDASRRCRQLLGGSGSLMIVPSITGGMHYEGDDIHPFHIGQVNPTRGFVHVLDDTSLGVLLLNLDTISDFVNYLSKKEAFIQSGRLMFAAGEEDLLAYYLKRVNGQGEHDFVIPDGAKGLAVQEGLWREFQGNPQREAQLAADEVSYQWDRMIERFGGHIIAGTSLTHPGTTVADQEKLFRLMAREPRLRRRLLAEAVVGLLEKTPHDRPLFRATRVVLPSYPGDPHYVFLLINGPHGEPDDHYRLGRRNMLEMLCMVAKVVFPDAQHVVGYATEPGPAAGRTEDAIYMDVRQWSPEQQEDAVGYQRRYGFLTNVQKHGKTYHEYPEAAPRDERAACLAPDRPATSLRNSPCPCGSGRKFKKCCLPRMG